MSELSCHRWVLLICKKYPAADWHNHGGLKIASLRLMTIVFFPERGSRSVTISLIFLPSISSSCFFKMSCPAVNSD